MSQNIDEILNVTENTAEAESCKDEKYLRTVADICLWVGGIVCFFLLLSLLIPNKAGEISFSIFTFITALLILFLSIILSALLKVVGNISITLKKMLK